MSYWPSYSLIGPANRLAYLQWLAGGRSEPNAYIGYVFLFFYGLERRVFLDGADAAETSAIVDEIKRLLSIYGGNNSFRGYAEGFVDAAGVRGLVSDRGAIDGYKPVLDGPAHQMPLKLKLVIASKVVSGQPLPFELAMAGLLGLRPDLLPFNGRVLEHARLQLMEMMRPRFDAACPLGFKLANRKDSRLHHSHRCATAGMTVNLFDGIAVGSLPDPATLTWNKLIGLAAPVAAQLEHFAKLKAYHPERLESLSAFSALPDGIGAEAVGQGAREARRWLERLPKPISGVMFSELAERALGERAAKWTLRHHRAISEALASTSYGLEPDPAEGSVGIADETLMFVFPDPGARSERSGPYATAAAGAELIAAVARLDVGTSEAVRGAWLAGVDGQLRLADAERTRLDAKLRWLESASVSTGRIKARLQVASEADRETVARLAASAAAAAGRVAHGQIALLEKVYDDLGLRRDGLYTIIHGSAASGAVPATEPVPVASGAAETVHRIPRPPAAVPARPTAALNTDRIKAIKAETERVSKVLEDVFTEAEPIAPKAAVSKPRTAFPGLDGPHAALLGVLATAAGWGRGDFEREARACGLLPDGALETINEWAYDRFDAPVLEEGDGITVDGGLLARAGEGADAD